MLTIKEVSEKYGISQDTLRYYERIGLIPPVPRTPGGIRDYQEKDLGWVEQAVCMRSAGVQINIHFLILLFFFPGQDSCLYCFLIT